MPIPFLPRRESSPLKKSFKGIAMTRATRSALPAANKAFVPPRPQKLPFKRPQRMTGLVSKELAMVVHPESDVGGSNNARKKKKVQPMETWESVALASQDTVDLDLPPSQQNGIVKPKRKRPVDWSDNTIGTMLALMKEYKVHNNGNINLSSSQWREILLKLQPSVDGLEELRQLRNKWDKLQLRYKDEKEAENRTGAAPSEWPWFEIIDDLKHGQTNDKDISGAGDDGDFGTEAFEEADMFTNH